MHINGLTKNKSHFRGNSCRKRVLDARGSPVVIYHMPVITLHQLLLLLPLLLPPLPLAAQTGDSAQVAEILQNLRERFSRIEDYRVDLKVSLEMPGLRMPWKKMTLTFKQPDKTRLEARGFAMVPRRGLALSPDSLFQKLRDLTMAGDTLLDGRSCYILHGLEEGPANQTFLAEMIVDRKLWLVRCITTYLEDHEVFRLRTEYVEVAPGIHMPAETNLRFQLNERFLRGRRGHEDFFDPDVPKPVLDDGQDMVGEASIIFSNYRVNHGIPDEVFVEEP